MSTVTRPEMLLWLSDARGVYIPRDFAKSFVDRAKSVSGVTDEDWATLEAGPDYIENEGYWDTWTSVCDNAIVTDEHGHQYHIYQEGDCWLVPVGMEWSDDGDCYQWPKEDEYDEEYDGDPDELIKE